jgi:RNA polymerase II subunit A-like phosphatase
MGTRSYALQVLNVLDPDQSLFGNRVLSRDESGSLSFKSLKRLFPVDTSMVVVIDDRGDVWEWCENLVKVKPCEFFLVIPSLNSL